MGPGRGAGRYGFPGGSIWALGGVECGGPEICRDHKKEPQDLWARVRGQASKPRILETGEWGAVSRVGMGQLN